MNFLASMLMRFPQLYLPVRGIRHRLGGWPEAEMALLPMLADPARLSVDVGAHAGVYTCALRKHSSGVVAFEPNPASARRLERLCPWAQVVQAAASNRPGTAQLRVPKNDLGRATISPENQLSGFDTKTIAVRTEPLDAVINDPVGLIKIDVEGHELEVLQGARGILERDRPTLIVEAEERHRAGSTALVFKFLSGLGYTGFVLDSGRLRTIQGFDPTHDQMGRVDAPTKRAKHLNNFIFASGLRST